MPEASLAMSGCKPPSGDSAANDDFGIMRLGSTRIGTRGVVTAIDARHADGTPAPELERILLEIGFVEGARIEVLHEGPFGRDPIAIRVDDMRVALRRSEASSVVIRPESSEDA